VNHTIYLYWKFCGYVGNFFQKKNWICYYLSRHVLKERHFKRIRFTFLCACRRMCNVQTKKEQGKWTKEQYESLICCQCHWTLWLAVQLDCCGQRLCGDCISITKYYCFIHLSNHIQRVLILLETLILDVHIVSLRALMYDIMNAGIVLYLMLLSIFRSFPIRDSEVTLKI
jgi:hypothetical protein